MRVWVVTKYMEPFTVVDSEQAADMAVKALKSQGVDETGWEVMDVMSCETMTPRAVYFYRTYMGTGKEYKKTSLVFPWEGIPLPRVSTGTSVYQVPSRLTRADDRFAEAWSFDSYQEAERSARIAWATHIQMLAGEVECL
jgi:hypothetical protein